MISFGDRPRGAEVPLTSFYNFATGFDVEVGRDEGDVGLVEDLCAVRQRQCPVKWAR